MQAFSLAIALLGAVYMAMLAFGAVPPPYPFIGKRIYDLYTLALLDGHFDLPLREIKDEGHYTPDGTGYLYHGLGPVLTRLPFVAFVDFPTSWIGSLSIWFWSVLGNVCYHKIFLHALDRRSGGGKFEFGGFRPLLALAIWFGSPGVLLVANTSLYHEPVAMAYALGGGFMLLIVRAVYEGGPLVRILVPLAVLSGLVVHARPHLAIGYYVGVCLVAAVAVRRREPTSLRHAAAAMLVLAIFGGALIASNALRFNNMAVMHGSFSEGDLQYGRVFTGKEAADSARARSFRRHGQFDSVRIVPNGLMYLAGLPKARPIDSLRLATERAFHSLTPWTGYTRVEPPNAGVLFLWPFWLLAAAFGLRRSLWRMPAFAGMAAAAIGGVLILSYATITLRYHVDLWPVIALPAAFGIARLVERMEGGTRRAKLLKASALASMTAGLVVTALCIGGIRFQLIWPEPVMPKEECLEIARIHKFSDNHSEELCRLPLDEEA